jgi:hypothetical protein
MCNDIKLINIKEFREKGYLQELNRRFLHPLGLALSVKFDENDNEILGSVWDYRNDEEGIYYDLLNSNDDRINKFKEKAQYIDNEFNKRKDKRIEIFNDIIEPIKNERK